MSRFKGTYPPIWTKEFRNGIRAKHDNKCERCGHEHDPSTGYCLTVHHLDNNKSNCEEWNLAALCQRCHLHIQNKVDMHQEYAFEHSDWMKPHISGMNKAIAAGTWPVSAPEKQPRFQEKKEKFDNQKDLK